MFWFSKKSLPSPGAEVHESWRYSGDSVDGYPSMVVFARLRLDSLLVRAYYFDGRVTTSTVEYLGYMCPPLPSVSLSMQGFTAQEWTRIVPALERLWTPLNSPEGRGTPSAANRRPYARNLGAPSDQTTARISTVLTQYHYLPQLNQIGESSVRHAQAHQRSKAAQ